MKLYESAKNMFYAYNILTILADLGVEVDTYMKLNCFKTRVVS